MIFLMCIIGVLSTLRAYLGYVYVMEFFPIENQITYGTVNMCVDCSVQLYLALYFKYSKGQNWVTATLPGVICALIRVLFNFFSLEESPKFLIS
jgi:hypothetical protein